MPHKDPEVARAYRKANAKRRYEAFKRWKASLTPEQREQLVSRNRERRRQRPEHFRELDRKSKAKNRERVLKRKREHHHKNRARLLVKMRDNAAKKRNERRAACKEWYQKNCDRVLHKAKETYQENRYDILARNRKRNAAKFRPTLLCDHCGTPFVRRHSKQRFCCRGCTTTHGSQIRSANRKAAQIHSDGVITKHQWRDLMNYFDWRCAYCGKRKKLTIDHVQPFSRGGSNDLLNLVPACKFCNCSKHDKNLIEFLFLLPSRRRSRTIKPKDF